jgi:hypothetical protein
VDLVITVDAEEDQWGPAPWGAASATNIEEIPKLQRLFNDHHIVPTYLLTYPIAQDEQAAAVFRDLLESGQCEIGMHCHPWNTPPYQEIMSRHNSMLCNLPASLQLEKVQRLHEILCKQFGRTPIAFRSGRWGFGNETAGILARLGCRVDTSITPYTSWTASGGPDFSGYSPHTFAFSSGDPSRNDPDGDMLEIPVTIGYVGGGSFSRCHELRTKLSKPPFQQLHVAGVLAKLGLVRAVWLSPERETPAHLIRLMRQSMREGCRLVNLVFHSSSLKVGCTPFVRTPDEKKRFLTSLSTILEFCRGSGVKIVPLSHATQSFRRNGSDRD